MLGTIPNKTETIYTLICDCKYQDVIDLLLSEINGTNAQSRALLSLIAYCYYHLQDFESAANYYEKLTKYYGYVEEYRVYYVQSLWKGGLYDEAIRASQSSCIMDPKHQQQMLFMRASIKYEIDDINGCLSILNASNTSNDSINEQLNIEYMIGKGCTLFKEDKFVEAKKLFISAQNIIGFRPDLAYNIAVCHYMLKNYDEMDKIIDEIISKGAKKNPNLSVGSGSNLPNGVNIKSVGITHALKQTSLIEAFNLKIAKEYQLKSFKKANGSLYGMPPREESELDHVTLHNTALLQLLQPNTLNEGFRKLNFLITQQSFPPETFQNLLISYIKHDLYDLAADVLAENAHLHELYLDNELYDLLDAIITSSAANTNCTKKFQDLGNKHIETLRNLTKKLNESKESGDTARMKETVNEYLLSLEKYIQVLMYEANIYWKQDKYSEIQMLFEKSREFCDNHDVWKLNYAHTLFMQETPSSFNECIRFYENIVKKFGETSILSVTAMVLANLCVAYIMTSQNEEAEELMRQIEREQERQIHINQNTKEVSDGGNGNNNLYHLCIVNLVIGTLYCCKENYIFGIQRIIKSLEPLNKKLSPDTWYHTKRCLLSYLQMLSKQIYLLSTETETELIQFLDKVEEAGADLSSNINDNSKTISYE
eukprot:122502_1